MKALGVNSLLRTKVNWPVMHAMLANWKTRQQLKELASADEWLLKDIGLTRNDVVWAINLPLSVNGAEALNRRTQRGRRAAAIERQAGSGEMLVKQPRLVSRCRRP